jgi:hypothetical protein
MILKQAVGCTRQEYKERKDNQEGTYRMRGARATVYISEETEI